MSLIESNPSSSPHPLQNQNTILSSIAFQKTSHLFLALTFALVGFFTTSISKADDVVPQPPSSDFTFNCITEFPTTTFAFRDNEKTVSLLLFHHNGTDYAPFWSNIIVPHDFEILQRKAELLKMVGKQLQVEFPRESCKHFPNKTFECRDYKLEPQTINGHQVSVYSIRSERVTSETTFGKFESVVVTMDLDVDKESLSIPMRYETNECKKGLSTLFLPRQ